MCIVTSTAFQKGDYFRLFAPFNASGSFNEFIMEIGSQCGYGANANNQTLWAPFLIDITDNVSIFSQATCVSTCPQIGDPLWAQKGLIALNPIVNPFYMYNSTTCKLL
jgi:hypothetical protein